jgi:eukaryotic-like serine/threonine-protein kinase
MTSTDLLALRRLFEHCLELPVEQRSQEARRLCRQQPELLDELLGLLERDQTLDATAASTDSGLAGLRSLALPEALMKDQRVGPYCIEACIGSGGMGSVYRARRVDGEVEQLVALKLLRPGSVNPPLMERFSTERRVLASLSHPGICRFLDAGQLDDGRPWVAMELIEGMPLLAFCDRHRLGLNERLALFRKVLRAVAYAHGRLVVHRDIKSGNILVGEDGEPRLVDFGIAKMLEPDGADLTQTMERYITPASTAPEQYLGEPASTACDIYALGQLLYQMGCGRAPFDFAGATPGQVERLLLEQPPPPPSTRCLSAMPETARKRRCADLPDLRQRLAGDFDTITLTCLRKHPTERYASVEQLDRDIGNLLEQRPILARRGERGYRLQKFIARNRLPVGLGTGLALTLVISLGVILAQAMQVNAERDRAVVERDRAQHAVETLRQAFVAADPARVVGGEVTARQILQSAREPLDTTFDSQPDLFASLAEVLAEVKLDLMLNHSAAELARRGIEAGSRAGFSDRELRGLWLLLARATTDSHDRQAARVALDRVRAMDTEARPDWLLAKGRWWLLSNRPGAAVERLLEAAEAHRVMPASAELHIQIHSQLGLAQSLAGAHDAGLDTFDALLEWLVEHKGPEHAQVALTRFRRIDALRRAGDLEKAHSEAVAVKSDVIEWYGPDSAMAGRVHGTLGLLHAAAGERLQAANQTRRTHDIWLAVLGADHPNVLRASINLAQQLSGLESHHDEAEAWYRRSLENAERHFGPDNVTPQTIRTHLARFLARQGRASEAVSLLATDHMRERAVEPPPPGWISVYAEALELAGCSTRKSSESANEFSCEPVQPGNGS